MKKILDIITKQQFTVVIIGFVTVAVFTILKWAVLDSIYKLACFMYLGLCLHQLEEYCFPGGFLWGLNTTMGSKTPSCWPGDRLSAGMCDVITTLIGLYFTIFQLSSFIVGCYAVFAIVEVIVHTSMGLYLKKHFSEKGKSTIYVPGSATSWLIFAPLGIASFDMLINKGLLTWSNLGWAIVVVFIYLVMIIIVPVLLLQDNNSVYTYAESMQKGYYKKFYNE